MNTFLADNAKNKLNISLLRLARKRKNKMSQTLGDAVDSYEAMMNDLQLQLSMLTSQSTLEVQKAEVTASQITSQLQTAEAQVTQELNNYSQELVQSVSAQVATSELQTKFANTDVYDLSFATNIDYSKINITSDKDLLTVRPNRMEEFRQLMVDWKNEVIFHQGLIKNTALDDKMLPDLYNARNYCLREYYLACIKFYQEATIVGFLANPTNNIKNLKDYIAMNENNIQSYKSKNEANRLSIGEEAYKKECDRIKYIEVLLVTAKYRLKYIQKAYDGKWTPPTFETLTKLAEERNLTYSRVVYDMSEYTRQTLCVPDWILGIAEMYNQVEMINQGPEIVPLNPFNPIWIRKAKEVMNLEAQGVVNTSKKLFICIDKYWEVLTGGFQSLEDYHVDAILAKAEKNDNTPVTGYEVTTDYDLVTFDEDQQMSGFFKKVFRGVTSVARAVVTPVVKVAGQVLVAASPVTAPVAKAVKASLDNTLGRVLPDSIYKKISGFTNASVGIVEGNLSSENFRGIVKGVMDSGLIGLRVFNEAMSLSKQAGLTGFVDKYTGGLMTSVTRLGKVPVKLEANEKINWRQTLIDALKVYTVYAGGATMFATKTATTAVGQETGLSKTSLGAGVLNAGALMATGQADFNQVATSGATQVGTKAVINNTALGQSDLGRTAAELGVTATANSIQANTAFSDEMRNLAESKARSVAEKEANKEIQKQTGLPLNVNVIGQAYDFATGDKTIEEVVSEAQDVYSQKMDELIQKGENLTEEEIIDKASKEADSYIEKQLESEKNKYGDQMFKYLLKKYGPQKSYSKVVKPDDYLNYQIYKYDPNQRTTNITYKGKGKMFGILIGAGLITSLVALNADS